MQSTHAIAKPVNKSTCGLLEIAHLHKRAGKVKIWNIGRLPLCCLVREAIAVNQLRPAIIYENRVIEAEAGTNDYTVVPDLFLHLIGAGEAHGDEVRSIAPLDFLNIAVQQCVL